MPEIHNQKTVPYSCTQMFDLVNKIEDYPQFLPWCQSVRLLSETESTRSAEITIAKGHIRQTISTCNHLDKPHAIELTLLKGPFKYFKGLWQFTPIDTEVCLIQLKLDFTFSNFVLSKLLNPIFTYISQTMVEAFCTRAESLYAKK